MVRRRGVRAAVVMLTLAMVSGSCASGDETGYCTDSCPGENQMRCLGSVIQTCSMSSNDCLVWITNTDCAQVGESCVLSGTTASCGGSTCIDECDTFGATRCSGTAILACTTGSDGCLHWTTDLDCADTNRYCDDSGATSICTDQCTDQCATVNDTQCQGNIVQTCTLGANTCLGWLDTTNCASSGQACVDDGTTATCEATCADECTSAGDTQCSGTVVQTCTQGGDGCLDWVSGTDCASGGEVCDDSGTNATCIPDCPSMPSLPSGPVPAHGSTAVDYTTVTHVDWADSTNATSYAAYFGTSCPPPAYPNAAYTPVTASELTGLTLLENTDYCWQAVAIASPACYRPGPSWSFRTLCNDAYPGAPTVTSSPPATYAAGTTSGTYTLTFSEPVTDVAANLIWTPIAGTGTMSVVAVDALTYSINFSGVADGDSYNLAVTTGITDTCGNSVTALTIPIAIDTGPGAVCADPYDLTGATFPVQLNGTFTEDPSPGGSCDTPYNAVWFSYTPTETGFYTIDAQNTNSSAYLTLAVFTGLGCNPHGAQVTCELGSSASISSTVTLTQGTTYLILLHSDGNSWNVQNPSIHIELVTYDPGELCAEPVDLNAVTLPYQATGTFTEDPDSSVVDPTCDYSAPTNAIWYTYTPPATRWYVIDGENNAASTYAYIGLVVYDSTVCDPLGSELACEVPSATDVSTGIYLTQGHTYLILMYTDGNSYPMVNPRIDIHPYDPGEICTEAIDLNTKTLPYQAAGTFPEDPDSSVVDPTCDYSAPTNAIWYTYTPPATRWYVIDGENNAASTYAYVGLVVYDGTLCDPLGSEVACEYPSATDVSTGVYLTQGHTYLILMYTDGNSYPMVNPRIDIHPYDPGEICTEAIDLNTKTLPYQATGTFPEDPDSSVVDPTCDYSAPTNAIWYTYTPPASRWYFIDGENNAASTYAYVGLVVYDGTLCDPLGSEVACEYPSAKTVSTGLDLIQGHDYLILLYTDGGSYPMVDPEIDISTAGAGEVCSEAIDITGVSSWPHQVTGTFPYEPPSGGSCNTPYNAVWFKYTEATGASRTITASNSGTGFPWSTLALFETDACSPLGTQRKCVSSTTNSVSTTYTMTSGTTYLILFHTDGNSETMVNPEITIQ